MIIIYLWLTLNRLYPRFINDIKLFYVFADEKEVIFIENDFVFAHKIKVAVFCAQNDEKPVDSPSSDQEPVDEPKKMHLLCREKVTQMMSGYSYDADVVPLIEEHLWLRQ